MNGKIVWSNLITPGITVTVMQVDLRLGLVMIDQQLWCEAHQKKCDRFHFGVMHPAPLGNGCTIEEMRDPAMIP
jgi:hypothetical protein